ncbi:MAG: caspase family protein, partial [Planctomycetes bacterium]|nr:caspase family protein [Planctomycetota bacterium]
MHTSRRVYVGIPVNTYQHFESLKFCVDDAWNVASLLKHRGQDSAVHVLTETTAAAMLAKLRAVVADLKSGDVLVLHLALHGVLDANDNHIFLLGGANEQFEPEHLLALSSLRSEVGSVEGLDVVLLVDACRGALGDVATTVAAARKVSVALDPHREAARDGGVKRTGVRKARFTEVFACGDHELAMEVP